MTRGFFITGTDTGVGKTFVTVALALRARALGRRVFAFKPIETGCVDGRLGEDQAALCSAAGAWQTGDLRGVYSFRAPVAPLVAATAEGAAIDLSLVVRTAEIGAARSDLTLVEGAGGWRVPITPEQDMSSLARALGLPILIVARAALGTINHSLLTIEAIERDGLSVAAVILSSHPTDDPAFSGSNASEIGRRWPGRVLVYAGIEEQLDSLVG